MLRQSVAKYFGSIPAWDVSTFKYFPERKKRVWQTKKVITFCNSRIGVVVNAECYQVN